MTDSKDLGNQGAAEQSGHGNQEVLTKDLEAIAAKSSQETDDKTPDLNEAQNFEAEVAKLQALINDPNYTEACYQAAVCSKSKKTKQRLRGYEQARSQKVADLPTESELFASIVSDAEANDPEFCEQIRATIADGLQQLRNALQDPSPELRDALEVWGLAPNMAGDGIENAGVTHYFEYKSSPFKARRFGVSEEIATISVGDFVKYSHAVSNALNQEPTQVADDGERHDVVLSFHDQGGGGEQKDRRYVYTTGGDYITGIKDHTDDRYQAITAYDITATRFAKSVQRDAELDWSTSTRFNTHTGNLVLEPDNSSFASIEELMQWPGFTTLLP